MNWSPAEKAVFRRLRTPEAIQRFLDDEIAYNLEPGGATCHSPRLVLRHGVAHCMEGALLAAAALEQLGHPPLLLDLEAVRDDDHVLALFRAHGHWGAIAKSNYAGLRFRTPVYRNLRELVMSYFDHYCNTKGEKTLRGWGGPVRLSRFRSADWRTAEEDVWFVPEYLTTIPHRAVLPPPARGLRFHMDRRLFEASQHGSAH